MITPNPLIPAGARPVVATLLARMRDDICTVQRPQSGLDAGGAPVAGHVTVAVVPCRVIAPGRMPIESVTGGRFGPVADVELLFAPDADVRSDDEIVVNGRRLHVVADQDVVSHGFQLKVMAKVTTT